MVHTYLAWQKDSKMKFVFLMWPDYAEDEELEALDKLGCSVYESRMKIPYGSNVIGRYSVLPHYKELETDLSYVGSKLINSFRQHNYIANFEWYDDLVGITPDTWTTNWHLMPEGKYVVKGRTNSRKHQWKQKMFAETKAKAIELAGELLFDGLISTQGIVIRKYEPLVTYDTGINDLPVTNEWRFFVYKNKIISSGYYWSSFPEYESEYFKRLGLKFNNEAPLEAKDLVQEAINRVGDKCNFYVVDVAEKLDGSWTVIELNDGQMSGISMNDPMKLYSGLSQ